MTARPLAVLDYVNYHTDQVLAKHAKNRPLGAIEQRYHYIPAQPVLSCRTVTIDLSGTRTYRPKTSDEILDEQQRLIRRAYGKQISRPATGVSRPTTGVSRPATGVSRPSTRHSTNSIVRPQTESRSRNSVEVRGRPLTSLSSGNSPRDSKVSWTYRVRPRTKERFKNIHPATETYLDSQLDEELLAKNQSIKKIKQQINTYWETGQNHLAQGIFMRGRQRPDDVPPKLDAWLTFGGAGGAGGEGVIDAFTSFKNTEDYYNIEGSIGSEIAKQIQKGDAIRIGINGDVQSRDLKIRKKSLKKSGLKDWNQEISSKRKDNSVRDDDLSGIGDETFVNLELKTPSGEDSDDEWHEFVEEINLIDTLKENMDSNGNERGNSSVVPLSWDDQCSKPGVKIIHPKYEKNDNTKRTSSETQPVKFQKPLTENGNLSMNQTPRNGYKIKQRSPNNSATNSTSKLKVVYIDTLTKEEEEKVHSMSVDEIVNFKLESLNRDSTADSIHRSMKELGDGTSKVDSTSLAKPNQLLVSVPKSETRSSRASSLSSQSSAEHVYPPSPKLKTLPIHPSSVQPAGDLSILTKRSVQNEKNTGSGKGQGRLNPSKPLHLTSAAQGSSIKPGLQQGDAEYILITSQLKVAPGQSVTPSSSQAAAPFTPYVFSPGSNTPRERSPSPLRDVHINTPTDMGRKPEIAIQGNSISLDLQSNSSATDQEDRLSIPTERRDETIVDKTLSLQIIESENKLKETPNESSAPASLAINIPTADDLSERESPAPSPAHFEQSFTS